jgi:magnesium transporter
LGSLEPAAAGVILFDAPTDTAKSVMALMSDEQLAACLDALPMDEAADLNEEIEPDRFQRLLGLIPSEDAGEIQRLLAFPTKSVGRLMTERFFHVRSETTMAELLADLRRASADKYESIHDVYVLDEHRHLIGVFSLRKALRTNPWQTAQEILKEDPVFVQADLDQLEAARTMSRYGFYSLPVLDDRGRMLGLFTGDDAQEILKEGETEHVLALSAVTGQAENYLSLSIWELFKRRIPWLLLLFIAQSLTGKVMQHYGQQELEVSSLIIFIPLLIGVGGNVGSQVTTTITRSIALEEIFAGDWLRVIGRELIVGILTGGVLGLLGYGRAYLPEPFGWEFGGPLAMVVAISLPLIVLWAGVVGSILPILAKLAGRDPAVMSAPLITTFVDVTGLAIYFEIALRLLPR